MKKILNIFIVGAIAAAMIGCGKTEDAGAAGTTGTAEATPAATAGETKPDAMAAKPDAMAAKPEGGAPAGGNASNTPPKTEGGAMPAAGK